MKHWAKFAFAVFFCHWLSACSTTPESPGQQDLLVWPPAPKPARFHYLTTLRSGADIEVADDQARLRTIITGEKRHGIELGKPAGIAAGRGMLYITDSRLRLVHVFDVPRRRYFQFGFRREGTLGKPLGIALDNRQQVYVVDAYSRQVVVYDRYGLFQRFIGSREDLTRPTAIAVSQAGDRIYVVDTGGVEDLRHRVVVYDAAGNKVSEIGTRGAAPGEFNLPIGAALGKDGQLYVLDAGNFRIQVFDRNGDFIRMWGGVGDGYGQFSRPKAIASDNAGNIYVADASFGNVQVFDADGRLLLPLGRRSQQDAPGQYALLNGLAIDALDYLHPLDQGFRKVDVIRTLRQY